jgi:hypothetical protein
MSETNSDVTIVAKFDDTDIKEGIARVNETLQHGAVGWHAMIHLWHEAVEVLEKVGEFMLEAASAAGKVDVITRRATLAIGEQVEALEHLNREREHSLGVNADEQLQMQTRFKMFGLHTDQLNEATDATIALAAATGQDLNSASRLVLKAFEGNFAALKRYGVVITDTEDMHEKFAEMIRVTQGEVGTYTRNVNALSAGYEHIIEQFGFFVTHNADLMEAMKLTIELLGQIEHGVAALAPAFNAWITGFKDIWHFIKDPFDTYLDGVHTLLGYYERLVALVPHVMLNGQQYTPPNNADSGHAGEGHSVGNADSFEEGNGRGLPEAKFSSGKLTNMRGKGTRLGGSGDSSLLTGQFAGPGGGNGGGLIEQITQQKELYDKLILLSAQYYATEGALHFKENEKFVRDEATRAKARKDATEGPIIASNKARSALILKGVEAVASGFGQLITNVASGSMSALQAIGGFFSGLLQQLGSMLFQLGAVGLAAATLGTIIPFLAPETGGPVGVVASLVTMGIGAAMMVGGALIGSATSGGAGAGPSSSRDAAGPRDGRRARGDARGIDKTTAARRRGAGGASDLPAGFSGAVEGGGPINNVYNVYFGAGYMVARTQAEAGRMIRHALRQANALGS